MNAGRSPGHARGRGRERALGRFPCRVLGWRAAVSAALVLAGVVNRPAWAVDSDKQCGVLAVFGALRAQGVAVDYADLIKPEYIGSALGSSLGELVHAVQDHGGHALPLSGLSAEVLRELDCPAILHVSGRESPGVYQHWLLFLGDDDGQAVISDIGGQVERSSYPELLARWDGAGLLVSAQPIDRRALGRGAALAGLVPLLCTAAAVGISGAVVGPLGRRLSSLRRSAWPGVAAILVGGSFLGLAHHAWAVSGLFQGAAARQTAFLGYHSQNLPQVDFMQLSAMLAAGQHTIIDARLSDSFERGHIPGALSLPINADKSRRARLLAGVPKSRRLIVYCQSASCPFDETVGAALVADGFTDVSLFPPGWAAWEEQHPSD